MKQLFTFCMVDGRDNQKISAWSVMSVPRSSQCCRMAFFSMHLSQWYCWYYGSQIWQTFPTQQPIPVKLSWKPGTPTSHPRVYRVVYLLLTGSSIKTNSQGHLYRAKAQEAERHGFFHGFTSETRLAFAKGLSPPVPPVVKTGAQKQRSGKLGRSTPKPQCHWNALHTCQHDLVTSGTKWTSKRRSIAVKKISKGLEYFLNKNNKELIL